ncbi:MAG: ABC transporter permease [Anaerolineae bacterium]|nr:ABC transporter permease [Anaerolineae bacterium]
MTRYILRRVLGAIPLIIAIITIVFVMLRVVIPGDPVYMLAGDTASPELIERIRQKYGLDRSVFEQYLTFIKNAVQGDLGNSIKFGEPVIELIAKAFPFTALLTGLAVGVGSGIGIVVGVITAVKRDSWIDKVSMLAVVFMNAFPTFWLGLILILIFSVWLRVLPVEGYATWRHLVLPVTTLSVGQAALIARLVRSTMLETLDSEYVRTGRAKGLRERRVVLVHALKNTLIPTITVIGLSTASLLGGAIITETIFGLPGIGRLTIAAIADLDYPLIQGTVLLVAVVFVLANILVDLVYAAVDPRIHYK